MFRRFDRAHGVDGQTDRLREYVGPIPHLHVPCAVQMLGDK